MPLPPEVADLLIGDPFGAVDPPKPDLPPPARAGRSAAIKSLGDYLCARTYWRSGGTDKPLIPFRVPREQFLDEWPDDDVDLVFPSIGVEPDLGNYESIGLGSYIREETRDQFGPGTVIQQQGEYIENLQVQIWASKKAERAALVQGIEDGMIPTEQRYGLYLKMPGYYNGAARFSLMSRKNIDEEAAQGRRTALLTIELCFCVVRLVRCVDLRPVVVFDGIGELVEVAPDFRDR